MRLRHSKGSAPPPRFPLGRIDATPGAIRALSRADQSPISFVERHRAGDWGDLCAADAALNDEAIAAGDADSDEGGRVLSSYTTALDDRIWIITEADRSATTILLPDES